MRSERPTSLSVGVGVDLAHQKAALVQLAVGLQGGAHQWVSCRAQPLHGVRGRVGPGVCQLRHGLSQLLLVTSTQKESMRASTGGSWYCRLVCLKVLTNCMNSGLLKPTAFQIPA